MTTRLKSLRDWVAQVAQLTSPDRIHWCDGTDQEYRKLLDEMLDNGTLRRAQSKHLPWLLSAPLAPRGRRAGRAPDLRLHVRSGRRGPQQQLESAGRGQDPHGVLFRGLHARPHDVRDPVLHGPDRLAVRALRRRNHRQRLRRREHVPHDANRQTGAETHRERQNIRQRPAFDGRARPGAALHRALPRGAHDHELRLGLRRQRVARQEVSRAAHRELSSADRRLVGRAHVDRRRAEPCRRRSLSRVRVPVGLRENESRHVDPAGEPAGLESLDARRRYRVDAPRLERPAAGDQSRSGLLRRRAGHEPANEPQRLRHDRQGHDLHERRRDGEQRSVVGRERQRRTDGRLERPLLQESERAGRASERAFHGIRQAESELLEAGRSPRRRADLSARVRRPAPRASAARLSGQGLGARRSRRRQRRVRDDGGCHRQGRRGAPRSDGHETVLRLQLRRLLGALAELREALDASCRRSSTSIGSAATRAANSSGPGFGDNLRVLRWIIDRCDGPSRTPSKHRSASCPNPATST